jgi:hypothetical protein
MRKSMKVDNEMWREIRKIDVKAENLLSDLN